MYNRIQNIIYLKKSSIEKLICISFFGIIILFNLHIFGFNFPYNLIFYPKKFISGKIFCLLTYPFVHVSLYHLIIDTFAFALLFKLLKESLNSKIYLLIFCIIGSALFACLNSNLQTIGLCGLSGPSHGLFAIYGLEIMENKYKKPLGIFLLIFLILKCAFEIISKNTLINNLHIGNVGIPVVLCHTGGMIGGILGYFSIISFRKILTEIK